MATGKRLSPCAAATTASGPDSSENIQNEQGQALLLMALKLSGLSWRDCCLYCCALGGYAFLSIG